MSYILKPSKYHELQRLAKTLPFVPARQRRVVKYGREILTEHPDKKTTSGKALDPDKLYPVYEPVGMDHLGNLKYIYIRKGDLGVQQYVNGVTLGIEKSMRPPKYKKALYLSLGLIPFIALIIWLYLLNR